MGGGLTGMASFGIVTACDILEAIGTLMAFPTSAISEATLENPDMSDMVE